MEKIVLLFICITETIEYWIGLRGIWGVKLPYYKIFLTVNFAGLVLIAANIINSELPLLWIFGLVIILFFSMEKQYRATLFKVFLIIACMDEITYMILLKQRQLPLYEKHIEYYLLTNIICICILTSIYLIKKELPESIIKKIRDFSRKYIHFVVLTIGAVLLFTISGIYFTTQYTDDIVVKRLLQLLTILSYIGVALLGVIFSYIDSENKIIKSFLETNQMLLKAQKEFYETMLLRENDTRRFRHDIRNHMICLEELVKQEKTEKVKEYLGELSGQLKKIEKRYYSVGNVVMDAIINYHAAQLGEDIDVKICGRCNCNLAISEVDLCTIISNLVQNAVEELKREEGDKRFLKIDIKNGETFFKMEIANSLSTNMLNTYLVTSKSDKKNHGIGLENVKETLERNHGNLEIIVKENVFLARIILPVEKI